LCSELSSPRPSPLPSDRAGTPIKNHQLSPAHRKATTIMETTSCVDRRTLFSSWPIVIAPCITIIVIAWLDREESSRLATRNGPNDHPYLCTPAQCAKPCAMCEPTRRSSANILPKKQANPHANIGMSPFAVALRRLIAAAAAATLGTTPGRRLGRASP